MAKLTNTPDQATILELEARKSFAFLVTVMDGGDNLTDLAGSSMTFSMGRFHPTTLAPELLVEVDAIDGVFHMQAEDLDLAPKHYPFVITWRFNGYSMVIVKGEVHLRDNVEFDSTDHQYGGAQPEQALLVTLAGRRVIQVEARGGANTGGGGGDGLDATGVAADQVPTAQGDDTWSWQQPDDDFVRDVAGASTDTVDVTVTGDKDVGLTVEAEVTEVVATKVYVDAPLGHLARLGTQRSRTGNQFVAGTETSLLLSTVLGGIWTTDPFDFPLDIKVDDVILRVTAITGTESPQTATVEQQPVNGVVKTIPIGSLVQIR